MRRDRLSILSAAWAIVAYLGVIFLAVPCDCMARAASADAAALCCCGPEAASPCHPAESECCEARLGPACGPAPEAPQALLAPQVVDDELPAPLPAAVLSLPVPEPSRQLASSARWRAPAPPSSRLDQVRSTVLRT